MSHSATVSQNSCLANLSIVPEALVSLRKITKALPSSKLGSSPTLCSACWGVSWPLESAPSKSNGLNDDHSISTRHASITMRKIASESGHNEAPARQIERVVPLFMGPELGSKTAFHKVCTQNRSAFRTSVFSNKAGAKLTFKGKFSE